MKTEEEYLEMVNQKIDEFWKIENLQSFSDVDKERIRQRTNWPVRLIAPKRKTENHILFIQ